MTEYRAATQSLVLLAQLDLQEFWGALDIEGNPVAVREALVRFVPDLVQTYGDTAALIGADWYDMLRDAPPSAASFRAVFSDPVDTEQARAATRWRLGPLFDGNPGDSLSLLSGATQRLVMQPFRDTVYNSARRDSVDTRFARVPSGPTCKFCTMVASRGFVYRTAETAGDSNRWHDNCNCLILPGRSEDDYPEGFDLNDYRAAYREGTGITD